MTKEIKKIVLGAFAIIAAIPLLYIAFIILVVGPVDNSKANCIQVKGVVATIEEGTSYDIVFRLKDNPHTFYINRGLENGLVLNDLQSTLTGKEIELWHANSRPLNGGHIAQVKINKEIIYSEWEK